MASLVADYSGTSEDESEEDTTEKPEDPRKNFLVDNGEEDAEDESSVEEEPSDKSPENLGGQPLPNPFTGGLPSPNLDSRPAGTSHLVFSNPFKEEQNRRESILEQHVKMTEHSKNAKCKKQICWKFKRGKCRFSKNCKFSHDIDNHIESPLVKNQNSDPPKQFSEHALQNNFGSDLFETALEEDEDNYLKGKRKKRSGMTDSLVPPKKAMAALSKIQAKERPWTVKRGWRRAEWTSNTCFRDVIFKWKLFFCIL